jgi:hypothetical protein
MGILKDVTKGIEPLSYQRALWNRLSQGGFKQGQMMIISAGRQTGKSYLNQWYGNNLCKEIFLPMKPEPKYKFTRANWYVAEYDNKHHFEVLEWCAQQFGPYPERPDAWSRWVNMYSEKIHFRDEKDYVFFMLRWS